MIILLVLLNLNAESFQSRLSCIDTIFEYDFDDDYDILNIILVMTVIYKLTWIYFEIENFLFAPALSIS